MNMAKRKRDIFTVKEAVPNWFEASEGVNEYSEASCKSVETYVDESTGQEVASGVQGAKGHVSRDLRGHANEARGRQRVSTSSVHASNHRLG